MPWLEIKQHQYKKFLYYCLFKLLFILFTHGTGQCSTNLPTTCLYSTPKSKDSRIVTLPFPLRKMSPNDSISSSHLRKPNYDSPFKLILPLYSTLSSLLYYTNTFITKKTGLMACHLRDMLSEFIFGLYKPNYTPFSSKPMASYRIQFNLQYLEHSELSRDIH